MPRRPRRPFYTEFAWAFDLLIDRPVQKECRTIVTWLSERRVLPGANVLDAGCGTGRYAIELARQGYLVHGVDASPELVAEARRSAARRSDSVSVAVGDITDPPRARYDAILCRGVLNDFVSDNSRQAVFRALRQALRSPGVLILDVREWPATAARKMKEPVFRRRLTTERGTLTYSSVTELDPKNRRLIVRERHTLDDDDGEHSSDYLFVMRCWTREELHTTFRRHGFTGISYFGAYDAAVAAGDTDRLVAVAQSSDV